jgi:hypothetical protein
VVDHGCALGLVEVDLRELWKRTGQVGGLGPQMTGSDESRFRKRFGDIWGGFPFPARVAVVVAKP